MGEVCKFNKMLQNNRYIVSIEDGYIRNGVIYKRIMCRRSDSKPIYSWQDLFRIKNELFGDEVEAIQFLPKKSELVDCANIYWLFIKEE